MTTSTGIHYVRHIAASCAPEIPVLSLSITGSGLTPHSISLFVEDATLAARIAIAINDIVRDRASEKEQEARNA